MRIACLIYCLIFTFLALVGWGSVLFNHTSMTYPLIFNFFQVLFLIGIIYSDDIEDIIDLIYHYDD